MSWLEKLSFVIVAQKLDCKYNLAFCEVIFACQKASCLHILDGRAML